MSFDALFAEDFAARLDALALLPTALTYERTFLEINNKGGEGVALVRGTLTPRLWRLLLGLLGKPNPEGQLRRMLGFGHQLSAFMVAPFESSPALRERVIRLGALANLIVAIYDHLLDAEDARGNPAPGALLALAETGAGRAVLRLAMPCLAPRSQIMMRLIARYFAELEGLTAQAGRRGVAGFIRRTIRKMYLAEQACSRSARCTRRQWLRKSGLPFVVMGSPILLVASPGAPLSAFAYLRSMYRLGEAYGVADDVADLGQDQARAAPNRVDRLLEERGDAGGVARLLGARVSGNLASIYRRWDRTARERAHPSSHAMVRWAPVVCLIAWLGGPSLLQLQHGRAEPTPVQ